ncbi:MAG: aldo/keto reductase [Persicimonas sp.]
MTEQQWLELRDETNMPAFGLGTWKSKPGEVYDAVRAAIDIGYRHIDCAWIYGNEHEVGRAIEDAVSAGTVERDELWVTSKLWNDAHETEHVQPAIEETLDNLRLEYVDLYLIHWPLAFRRGVEFPDGRDDFLTLEEAPLEETWEAMIGLKESGLTRQIGVSNMGPERIEMLSKVGQVPAVVQVESHPHLQQRELLSYCNERGIVLTAYSPLGSTDRQNRKPDEPPLMGHETIEAIADEVDASPAQVLIAWALQRGTSVIPKSVTRSHIADNYEALDLELTDEHMERIAQMDKGYRYLDGEFFCGEDSPYEADQIWV